jgi:Tol biopolymer transport system component
MHLTLSDIDRLDLCLSADEAAGLVLAAAREFDRRRADEPAIALPPAELITLDREGAVSFAAAGRTITDRDRVRELGLMLSRLLTLDGDDRGGRPSVPGGLLVLVARAIGRIDLPAPSWDAFVDALSRFGTGDAATLRAVYWRCRSGRPDTFERPDGPRVVVSRRREERADQAEPADRRRNGPTRDELRRELRETEQRLFEVLQQQAKWRRYTRFVSGRTVAASISLLAGLLWLATAMSPDSTDPPRNDAVMSPAMDRQRSEANPGSAIEPRPADTPAETASPLVPSASVGDDAFSPSFAPHGRQVLFHAGRTRAALMRATLGDGGDLVIETILRDGAANYHATLSPDGEWLAYDSDLDGTRGVYVARADASAARKISGDGHAAVPTWSPDGRQVAFIKAEPRRPRVWNVWIADLRRGDLRRISSHLSGQAWGASWFPSGDRVAYSVEDRLVIAPLDGGVSTRFASPIAGRLIRTPAVSPDGRFIVFQVSGDGVWLLDFATRHMRRVMGDATAEEFTWSPDGREVAYHARRAGAWSVWRLALDPDAT